ncbi:adenylate cyclase, partial [Trypanosoma conorhini]
MLVCVLLACTTGAWAQQPVVKLLDLLYTDDPASNDSIKAYKSGVSAALRSRNFMVDERQLQRIAPPVGVAQNDVRAVITQAMTTDPDILAVVGPVGDETLLEALPVLEQYDLVALGPYTGSATVRYWETHFYFLRTDPMSGLYAHIWYVTTYLRVYRLGFMYLTDVSYGDDEYAAAEDLMEGMGYSLCGVFKLPGTKTWSESDAGFQAAWEAFVATRPQAVIVFGKPSTTTEVFIRKMLHDDRTRGVYLLSPLGLQSLLVSTWKDAVVAGLPFVAGQIITTGANPLANDMRYDAIKRFQMVMEDYLKNSGQTDYSDADHFLKNELDGELMVAGWEVGEVLLQLFASREWTSSHQAFQKSLFNQRRYVIDDLVIGDFGGACEGQAAVLGAICECNQGGRTVYIKTFNEYFKPVTLEDDEFTYPLSVCYPSSVHLLTPINALEVLIGDSKRASYATNEISCGEKAAIPASLPGAREFMLKILPGTRAEPVKELQAELSERRAELFLGVVVEEALGFPSLTYVDPVELYVAPHLPRYNVVYLSATLEQQLFRLVEYLSASSVEEVHAIISGPHKAAVADVLRRTLVTFGVKLKSIKLFEWQQTVIQDLPSAGWVFVLGIFTTDLGLILDHVAAHSDLHVLMSYDDHNLLYPYFVGRKADGATDRVLFATNMPHWGDTNSPVRLVHSYHGEVTNKSQWSPMSLKGYAVVRAILALSDVMDIFSADLFLVTLYMYKTIYVEDMVFGPFDDGLTKTCDETSDCLVNYGASLISVWSMSRSLDPSLPRVAPPMTPSMRYVEPTSGLTKMQLFGIILGVIILVIIAVVVIVVVLMCCRRDSRDNANAPKEPTDPVTLVFTDIESSTALWAACPELMPDAVATHHR